MCHLCAVVSVFRLHYERPLERVRAVTHRFARWNPIGKDGMPACSSAAGLLLSARWYLNKIDGSFTDLFDRLLTDTWMNSTHIVSAEWPLLRTCCASSTKPCLRSLIPLHTIKLIASITRLESAALVLLHLCPRCLDPWRTSSPFLRPGRGSM